MDHPLKDLVFEEFCKLELLPLEIVNYIFSIIYLKGCLILEDGKIEDYYHSELRHRAIFISIPYDCSVISSYSVNIFDKSGFPNVYSINFHNNIRDIFSDVFLNNQFLTRLELPDSIINIRDRTFENCINLEYIKLPKNLESIGDNTFKNCIKLKEIIFNNKIRTIGMSAFQNCSQLEYLYIPKNIKEIALYAFTDCNNLKIIEFENNIGYFDYLNFDYIYGNNNNFNEQIGQVKHPKYTVLHEGCFRLYSPNLKKIILKDKRSDIEDWIAMVLHQDILQWNETLLINEDGKNDYIYEK